MVEVADTLESTRELPRLAEGLEFGPEETAGGTLVAFLPPDRYLEVSSQTARVLRLVDGERDIRTLAQLASAELATEISPEAFQTLLDQHLVPCGLVRRGEPAPAIPSSDRKRRVVFIPGRVVAAVARAMGWLYRPPVAAIVVASSVGAQLWFFLDGAGSLGSIEPSTARGWLTVIALYMASMLAHEFGHAAALRHFGMAPGAIGIDGTKGVPRWGSVVTGIWRLRRRQRVIVDLGGVYFQALFVGALILLPGILPGLIPGNVIARAVAIVDLVILFTLAPRWRADGFWLAADLATTRYPRDDESITAGEQRSAPGAYAGWYGLVASAGFAGLWMWLARDPAFDTRIAPTRFVDGPAFFTLVLGLGLKALVLVGLALSLWTGLAWLAAAGTFGRARRPPGEGM